MNRASKSLSVALVGDSGAGHREQAAAEALDHCSAALGSLIEKTWFETEALALAANLQKLGAFNGIWIVPGSPYKNLQGALSAIRLAREQRVPLLGTCAGFQHLILEFVRNVLGKTDAAHAEYDQAAHDQAISLLACSLVGRKQKVRLDRNSTTGRIYGREFSDEEFRCSYGLNASYIQALDATELRMVGWDETGETRVVELANHPFFVGTLFIPQYSSSAAAPHPLISAFVKAAAAGRQ